MAREFSQSEADWRTAFLIMDGAGIIQAIFVAALAFFLAESL